MLTSPGHPILHRAVYSVLWQGEAGAEAGKLEVKKHNVLEMKPEEIETFAEVRAGHEE